MFTFMEALFLLVCALNSLIWGRWAPKWYENAIQPYAGHFFTAHGPACALVLYFATGENQWKYVPGIMLNTLLYDCGSIWSAEWFTLTNIIALNLHHAGPIVAFYFQRSEEAWLNAILYFQVWYIHGFAFLRTHILPALGLGEVAKGSDFDYWLHRFYAVMTPVTYALYVQYMPVGLNYATAAMFLQVVGRYTAASNLKKVDWMRRLEAPGLLVVACYSYCGLKVTIPVLLIYATLVYFLIEKASVPGCQKLVLTDEIREFMRTFPDEEPLAEDELQKNAQWFDAQSWAQKYPLFRAVALRENAKVADLLKEGASPSAPLTELWNSTPMQWACSGGGVSTMKLLIEAGANPFAKGVRDNYYYKEHSRKFYDDLQVLAQKDEETVSRVNVELLGSLVTFEVAQDLAKSKGGRLVTSQEAKLLLAHRAAADKPVDGDELVDIATCVATTDTSHTTFACKIVQGEETGPVIISGEACTEASPCSLLLWIVPKEEAESKRKEGKDTTELKEKAA